MTDAPETPEGLRPANENPWYVLMTLYGEQEGEEVDWELHEKNSKLWNRLVSNSIGEAVREKARELGLSVPSREEFHTARPEAWKLFREVYRTRNECNWQGRALPQFRTGLAMGELHFENTLVMQGMMIPHSILLDGSFFDKGVVAASTVFDGGVSFDNVEAVAGVDVNKSYFSGSFSAQNSTFHGLLEFRETECCNDVDFSKVLVKGDLFATHANFGGIAKFEDSKFSRVYFQRAKFQGDVSFAKVVFGGEAKFQVVEFSGSLDFQLCHFKSNACFQGGVFNSIAGFRSTQFDDGAWFTTGLFHKRVDFGEAKFYGITDVSKTNVTRAIRFDGCDFQAPVSFDHATFSSSYPQLNGTSFPDNVTFSANDQHWPKHTPQDTAGSKEACATIRHLLTQQGLPEDAHFFFRREMRFASQIGSFWQRLPYRLFGWLSDFGYSIQRPLVWLLCLWAFGGAAFWGYLASCRVPTPPGVVERPMGTAMALSFSNLFPLFGFGRVFLSEVLAGLPRWAQVLSGAQTVLSLPLLFFLGLALRQRFRLR
ncbi:pentapeptide repeat-containing protein [Epibacterium sp. Ofav1-8]|nr:pentapeptide repeat-containing protein [Epibacterium sp. Ofav1-8]